MKQILKIAQSSVAGLS